MNNDFENHSWAESLTIRTYIANMVDGVGRIRLHD